MAGNNPTNERLASIARKSIVMSPTLCFFFFSTVSSVTQIHNFLSTLQILSNADLSMRSSAHTVTDTDKIRDNYQQINPSFATAVITIRVKSREFVGLFST